MIWIYSICYLIFPILILPKLRRQEIGKQELINRGETNLLKGIATIFVILAHLTIPIDTEVNSYFLKPFSVLGGIGVLIFFFLSGYGIYQAYEKGGGRKYFIKKRIIGMYIPYVIIKLLFLFANLVLGTMKMGMACISYVLYGDWFIDVILIEYFIFYIMWCLQEKIGINRALLLNYIVNMAVIISFIVYGMNPRWYNGLLLFPIGMTVARNEKKIQKIIDNNCVKFTISNLFGFCLAGVIFTYFKGCLWADFIKTSSGLFCVMFICGILRKISCGSKILIYIGEHSLYYYIVHIHLIDLAENLNLFNAKNMFLVIIATTAVLVEAIYRIISDLVTNNLKGKNEIWNCLKKSKTI